MVVAAASEEGRRGARPNRPDPHDRAAADAVALRILNGADQSSVGLHRRLVRRGFSVTTADQTVAAMASRGYIDDPALARAVAGRRLRDGYGRVRLAADLRHRGLQDEVIADVLTDVDPATEREGLRRAAQRLGGPRVGEDTAHHRARIGAALQRRGHPVGHILSILRELGSVEAE